jgi:hypothetical protein
MTRRSLLNVLWAREPTVSDAWMRSLVEFTRYLFVLLDGLGGCIDPRVGWTPSNCSQSRSHLDATAYLKARKLACEVFDLKEKS